VGGHQFAELRFTNKSATVCAITGFPGIQLLKAGHVLGQAAIRYTKPAATINLRPGSVATTRLTDISTCNADLSDSVQIIVPNRRERTVLPLRLRGCTLYIDPVAAG
jgi:hypothetical protein